MGPPSSSGHHDSPHRILRPVRAIGLLVGVALFNCAMPLSAAERLTPNSVAVFADLAAGRRVLTNRDDFIRSLSPFDRAARLKTDREVTEAEFLAFLGQSVRSWSSEETDKLTRVCRQVREALAEWAVPLPDTVLLVKTSGEEEGRAAYTRGEAVIFPVQRLGGSEQALQGLLTHELFHILSRHQPALRERLYGLIGFRRITPVTYPAPLRDRRITNPDGFTTDWAITVTNATEALPTIPVLYAKRVPYDPKAGGEFFNYLEFKLLAVTRETGQWQPRFAEGKPLLLDAPAAGGFFDQIGKNTTYIIHPDEILADNFVDLTKGKTNVPSPQILTGMRSVLARRDSPQSRP